MWHIAVRGSRDVALRSYSPASLRALRAAQSQAQKSRRTTPREPLWLRLPYGRSSRMEKYEGCGVLAELGEIVYSTRLCVHAYVPSRERRHL